MKLEDVIVVTTDPEFRPRKHKICVPYIVGAKTPEFLRMALHRAVCDVWRRNYLNDEVERSIAGMKVGMINLDHSVQRDFDLNVLWMSQAERDVHYINCLNPINLAPVAGSRCGEQVLGRRVESNCVQHRHDQRSREVRSRLLTD